MTQRIFIIGGEWIYFKIYSGPKTIENIFINYYVQDKSSYKTENDRFILLCKIYGS